MLLFLIFKYTDSTDLIELKKIIRAILISHMRTGITMSTLEQLYINMTGIKIPLLGHVNMENLLLSMSDTIVLVRNTKFNIDTFLC